MRQIGFKSIVKSFLQILWVCHCKLFWFSCLEHDAVHTKGADIQAAEPASGKVLCCLAHQINKGGEQKGHDFQRLPYPCQGLGEPAETFVGYCENFLPPRASYSFLFYLPVAKMCWSQAQDFVFLVEKFSCRWLQQHSVKCRKRKTKQTPLLIGIFIYLFNIYLLFI